MYAVPAGLNQLGQLTKTKCLLQRKLSVCQLITRTVVSWLLPLGQDTVNTG